LLSKASTVAMLSFVVSSMLAMGAGLTIPQIAEPLRNARLVVLALLANFVVMPLGALALARVLWLDRTLWYWAPPARLCGWSAVLAEAR
jgi:predicted Na+-dependent transporter